MEIWQALSMRIAVFIKNWKPDIRKSFHRTYCSHDLRKRDKFIGIISCGVLLLLFTVIYISYRYRFIKTKNLLNEKEKERLQLQLDNLHKEKEKLELERQNAKLECERQMLAAENSLKKRALALKVCL